MIRLSNIEFFIARRVRMFYFSKHCVLRKMSVQMADRSWMPNRCHHQLSFFLSFLQVHNTGFATRVNSKLRNRTCTHTFIKFRRIFHSLRRGIHPSAVKFISCRLHRVVRASYVHAWNKRKRRGKRENNKKLYRRSEFRIFSMSLMFVNSWNRIYNIERWKVDNSVEY